MPILPNPVGVAVYHTAHGHVSTIHSSILYACTHLSGDDTHVWGPRWAFDVSVYRYRVRSVETRRSMGVDRRTRVRVPGPVMALYRVHYERRPSPHRPSDASTRRRRRRRHFPRAATGGRTTRSCARARAATGRGRRARRARGRASACDVDVARDVRESGRGVDAHGARAMRGRWSIDRRART